MIIYTVWLTISVIVLIMGLIGVFTKDEHYVMNIFGGAIIAIDIALNLVIWLFLAQIFKLPWVWWPTPSASASLCLGSVTLAIPMGIFIGCAICTEGKVRKINWLIAAILAALLAFYIVTL